MPEIRDCMTVVQTSISLPQVMNRGQVRELDSPYALLQRPHSQFHRMVEQTGPSASRKLLQMALEAHQWREAQGEFPN